MKTVLDNLKGKLIVSCQALDNEPLHSPFIMSRMAVAAEEGGAEGIRANSVADIAAIKQLVSLPVIGIIKRDYPDSEVFITATMKEVDELMSVGPELIALDATARPRPGGQRLDALVAEIRAKYPSVLLMADISTAEEALTAQSLGFDCVGTTLYGYTAETEGHALPENDCGFLRDVLAAVNIPVVAEGTLKPRRWRPGALNWARIPWWLAARLLVLSKLRHALRRPSKPEVFILNKKPASAGFTGLFEINGHLLRNRKPAGGLHAAIDIIGKARRLRHSHAEQLIVAEAYVEGCEGAIKAHCFEHQTFIAGTEDILQFATHLDQRLIADLRILIADGNLLQRRGHGAIDLSKFDAIFFTCRNMHDFPLRKLVIKQHHQRIGAIVDGNHIDPVFH